MSGGGTELLALTAAAVRPLLQSERSSEEEVEEEETIVDTIDRDASHGLFPPSYTIFSPLAHTNTPVLSDHSPSRDTTPTTLTDHTPSPLTITAREVKGEDDSSSMESPWSKDTPDHHPTSHPNRWGTPTAGNVTPVVAPTPSRHGDTTVYTPGGGRVKIRISARKLREVPSPLSPSTPSNNVQLTRKIRESTPPPGLYSQPGSPSVSAETPGALPLPLSPSSSSSSPSQPQSDPTATLPTASDCPDKLNGGRSLAQGLMKSSHNSSSADTTLENSIIVSQIESALPTQAFKDKLFEEQARQKQARFKVVHQPQMVQKHSTTAAGTTNLGKIHRPTEKRPKLATSSGKARGGERCREPGLQKPSEPPPASKSLLPRKNSVSEATGPEEGRLGLTRLPVASPGLPRHLPHSPELTSAPTDSVFPENPSPLTDSSSRHSDTERGPTTATNKPARRQQRHRPNYQQHKQPCHEKHFSSLSSRHMNHAHTSAGTTAFPSRLPPARDSVTTLRPPLHELEAHLSVFPHSSSQRDNHLPSNSVTAPVRRDTELHGYRRQHPFDFEETVKMVATCTAAATAAAITNLQKISPDEAKTFKDVSPGNSVSHKLTSKGVQFQPDCVMDTTAHTFSNIGYRGPLASVGGLFDHRPPARPGLDEEGGVRRDDSSSRGATLTSRNHLQETEKTTPEESPSVEKKTKTFTKHLKQSNSERGFGVECKQSAALSNQTPHAGTQSGGKTQSGINHHQHAAAHEETSSGQERSNGMTVGGGNPPTVGPLGALHHATSDVEGPGCWSSLEEKCGLSELEKILREVQETRREIEEKCALQEVQDTWKDPPLPPPPSVPTKDLPLMDSPEHRMAVFLNQLRETSRSCPTVTHRDTNKEDMESLSYLGGEKIRYPNESTRAGKGREKGKKTSASRPSLGSRASQKEKKHDLGFYDSSLNTKKTKVTRLNKKRGRKEEKFVSDVRDTGNPCYSDKVSSSPHQGVDGCTLPPPEHRQPSRSGVVVCDPSTGVPFGCRALSEAHAAQMRHTLSLLPPPTCTHPPTVGPITTPSTTNPPPPPLPPPVTHSRTQTQATHPPVTHSSVAGVGVSLADVGSQTTHITTTTTTDTGIQTSPMMGSRVSVADAYLQTSFTGWADITIPVPTPVEEGSSDVYGEFPRASRHFATTVDIETETSQMDAPETDDSRGISLVGNQAGVSSSGAAVDLSFPTVEERGKKWELSAEEMNKRMSKHLENQVTEWVTRELLTRALAAANQPCDVVESHDENTPLQLDCSPNSCSTCSPSPLTRAHLTSAPQPTDIIGMGNMEGDGDGHTGSEGVRRGGGEGVRVRGDEVEVMVREVIREKVAEALMKQTHSTEESPVDDGGRSNATSYSESTSDTTPLVLTPSPSPPPPHTSPPPSPSSQHDTTSLHSHPQVVATPTATPPLSQRSPSTTVSQSHTFSTPLETEEDTSGVAVEEETFDPKGEASARTGTPLPTPPPSPPHQAPPTLTPPSATRDPTPPPSSHPRPNQPKTFDFSLSESCSSASPSTTLTTSTSSTEAHPHHSHTITTTTTNLTTDQEISAGEFTRTRPPPLPGAANSLSEGEVALSPGDAAWYTAYATKIGSLGRPPTTTDHDPLSKTLKVSPIVAAFLDLKNSPESLCDTSDYSESYQSNSYYVASAGEVRVKPRQCGGKSGGKSGGGDPLERFLASLQSSTPDTSSTPTPPTSGDNTLSDMPSISADNNDDDDEHHNNDEPISQGEARGKKGLAPRHLQATGGAMQVAGHSLGLVDNGAPPVVPYHVKFPLEKGEAVSPGEVRGGERVRKDWGKKHNLSVSFVHSEGEVNRVVRGKTEPGKVGDRQQLLSRIALASSPGELRIRTSNETRDGIDVIRVSRSSHNSSYSTSLHTHSSPTPPGVTPRRLRVSSELGPSRVLSVVTPALATNSMAKCSADESGQERAPSSSTPDSREPAVIPRRPAAAPSVDGFPPNEDKESPDSTRPPRLDSLLDTSSSSSSPGVSPPRPLTLSEKSLEQQSIVISGGTAGNRLSEDRVHLNSFWETQTPDITSPFTHRAVQRQQATPYEVKSTVDHTPLVSSETRAQGTGGGGKQTSETAKSQVGEEGTIFVPTPSPTRPQHTISIPTGTVEGERSPTYSTDFDFSSISQPTFD